MRFTLIIGSLGILILLTIFTFLLFRISETEKVNEDTAVPQRTEQIVPLQIETTVSEESNVSRESTSEELPLGTDIQMEYPIPD